MNSLPWYRIVWLKFLCGAYRTSTFQNYLHTCFLNKWSRPDSLDLFSRSFIERADVLCYYHEYMPYRWRAVATQGEGKLDLGLCTLSQAQEKLAVRVPRAILLSTDDCHHYLFYKLPEQK
jgi:hypothetical protein